MAKPTPLLAELSRHLPGSCFGPGSLTYDNCRGNMGNREYRSPKLVVRAANEAQVQRVLAFADRQDLAVVTRGAGHSMMTQNIGDDCLLLWYLNDLQELPEPDESGAIEVDASIPWLALREHLLAQGRDIPVLTDYLSLTVAGTLSAGGHGPRSVGLGSQLDQAIALRIVSADGQARWCSADQEPELFALALGGQGAVGVITRARIRTVPARLHAKRFRYIHPDAASSAEVLVNLDAAVPGQSYLASTADDGRFHSILDVATASPEAAHAATPPAMAPPLEPSHVHHQFDPSLGQHQAVGAWHVRHLGHRAVWTDLLVPLDRGREMLAWVQREYAGADIRRVPFTDLLLVHKPQPGRPQLPFAAQLADRPSLSFGFYFMVSPNDDGALHRVYDFLDRSLDKTVALGGRPYLYGYGRIDESTRRALYGAGLDRLAALRKRIDPKGLLNPGKPHPAHA